MFLYTRLNASVLVVEDFCRLVVELNRLLGLKLRERLILGVEDALERGLLVDAGSGRFGTDEPGPRHPLLGRWCHFDGSLLEKFDRSGLAARAAEFSAGPIMGLA